MVHSREYIIEKIREAASQTSYKKIWIFGSVSRNEHDEHSDIDLLIERPTHHKSLNDRLFMHGVLEELSGQEINHILYTEQLDKLKMREFPYVYENIERDKILIYENVGD